MPTGGVNFRNKAGTGVVRADGVIVGPGAGVSAPKPIVSMTITVAPPSLTALATPATASAVTGAITATGSLLGDRVELFPPYDLQGVVAQAYVTANDTIKIVLLNTTTATVALASGAWGIVVSRR